MIGKKTILELRRKTLVSDGMGGFVEGWAGLRYITGVLAVIRGIERLSADKLTIIQDHNFYINYPVGITLTELDEFYLGQRRFKIIFVNNLGASQNLRLKITLKEEV